MRGEPSPLDEVPEADIIVRWYMKIFYQIAAGRQFIFTANGLKVPYPLNISDIMSYVSYCKIPGSIEELLKVIQKMDHEYLYRMGQKLKQQSQRLASKKGNHR